MAVTARGYPRFVPTLTEVVRVSAPPPEAPAPIEPPVDPAVLEAERRAAVAERVRAQLRLALDSRMQDAVAAAMLEQVDAIGERLRLQMEDMVRQSLDGIAERLRAEMELLVQQAVDAVVADDGAGAAPQSAD